MIQHLFICPNSRPRAVHYEPPLVPFYSSVVVCNLLHKSVLADSNSKSGAQTRPHKKKSPKKKHRFQCTQQNFISHTAHLSRAARISKETTNLDGHGHYNSPEARLKHQKIQLHAAPFLPSPHSFTREPYSILSHMHSIISQHSLYMPFYLFNAPRYAGACHPHGQSQEKGIPLC